MFEIENPIALAKALLLPTRSSVVRKKLVDMVVTVLTIVGRNEIGWFWGEEPNIVETLTDFKEIIKQSLFVKILD